MACGYLIDRIWSYLYCNCMCIAMSIAMCMLLSCCYAGVLAIAPVPFGFQQKRRCGLWRTERDLSHDVWAKCWLDWIHTDGSYLFLSIPSWYSCILLFSDHVNLLLKLACILTMQQPTQPLQLHTTRPSSCPAQEPFEGSAPKPCGHVKASATIGLRRRRNPVVLSEMVQDQHSTRWQSLT